MMFSVKQVKQVVSLHFQRFVEIFPPSLAYHASKVHVWLFWHAFLDGDLLQDVSLQGDKSLRWPLWFRAATPGTLYLYFTIYYEMESVSSVMKYRTLRMHYNLQVMNPLGCNLFCFRNWLCALANDSNHIYILYSYLGFTIPRDFVWNHPISI